MNATTPLFAILMGIALVQSPSLTAQPAKSDVSIFPDKNLEAAATTLDAMKRNLLTFLQATPE